MGSYAAAQSSMTRRSLRAARMTEIWPCLKPCSFRVPAAKIDFWAHGMHVSGGGYAMVWFYISHPALACTQDVSGRDLSRGLAGVLGV
jgi:hypothetical protein